MFSISCIAIKTSWNSSAFDFLWTEYKHPFIVKKKKNPLNFLQWTGTETWTKQHVNSSPKANQQIQCLLCRLPSISSKTGLLGAEVSLWGGVLSGEFWSELGGVNAIADRSRFSPPFNRSSMSAKLVVTEMNIHRYENCFQQHLQTLFLCKQFYFLHYVKDSL